MPKAFITGLSGFVGSHLADYLLAHTNWDIHGLIRWNDSLDNIEHLIPAINDGRRIFLKYGDLNDPWSLNRIIADVRPDYVFHLAAQSYPKTSFDAPADTLDTNIIGTLNLLEALRSHESLSLPAGDRPLIHVCSSSEVYGKTPKEFIPIKEDCPFHPASPYAVSKVGTDLLGRHYAEAYGMNILVTRMFSHSGARRGDVFAESSFAKQIAMIEAGRMKPPIKVGNLNSLRTIADVRDAVRAYYLLLTVKPEAGEVYNIGGSHTCTVGDILDALFRAAGNKYDVVVDPQRLRPIDADLQVPDYSKFKTVTGWEPEISFEQTMRDLLTYWRDRVKRIVPLQR